MISTIKIFTLSWEDGGGMGSKPFLSKAEAEKWLLSINDLKCPNNIDVIDYVREKMPSPSFQCSLDCHEVPTTPIWHKIMEEDTSFGVLYDPDDIEFGIFDGDDEYDQSLKPALIEWCRTEGMGIQGAFYETFYSNAPNIDDLKKIKKKQDNEEVQE